MAQSLFDGNLGSTPATLALKPGAFQVMQLTTAWANASGAYNAATGCYAVTTAGVYQVNGTVRVADNSPANVSYGAGVGGANADDEGLHWTMTHPAAANGGTARNTVETSRTCHFNAGETVRLYAYADAPLTVTAASMQILLLAAD